MDLIGATNRKAYEELDRKFFDRSYCYPSCPLDWAPEVLELLSKIDDELGIERNTETIRAYYPRGNPLSWFFVDPIFGLYVAIKSNFISPPSWSKKTSFLEKLSAIYRGLFSPIGYGGRCLKVKYLNPIINKILKPKVKLSQVKEKYGTLRVYYDCHPAYDKYVESLIRECEIKLAIKGVYRPLESMWNDTISYGVNDIDYHPDDVIVESNSGYKRISETKYRNIMKQMSLNVREIRDKALKLKQTESGNE